MEGVMMRGKNSASMTVRQPDGSAYTYEEGLNPRVYRNRLLRLPFLRGMLLLWDMLILGTRLMTISSNLATGALTPGDLEQQSQKTPTHTREELEANPDLLVEENEKPPVIGGASLVLMVLVSLTFAIAIFFMAPLFLTHLLQGQIGTGWLNLLLEGVIRLVLLVGYLYLIGRVPDIQRVFGYHGAEHKAINAMEHGDPLDVAHVRRASRVHTRCGTGFLLLVMVVSIFVFALVGTPSLPLKILSRIVLVPVIAGISYELMRLGAANYRYRIVRWLLAPGLALQGLTTREPDDAMIECAIASLQRVVQRDQQQESSGVIESPTLPPLVVSK